MPTQGLTAERELQLYRNSLRFPKSLEHDFRVDFGMRQPPMLRRFFLLGVGLYLSFSILDYYALPSMYRLAWGLRLFFGATLFAMAFGTNTPFFKRNATWIPAVWTFWAGVSVLILIYLSRPGEPGFVFYAFGLLLILAAIYIPSSGNLVPPSVAGWAIVIAYLLVGAFDQHLMSTPGYTRVLLVNSFNLVGMNFLCMIGGSMLVISQRRDFLQRRLIEEQRATEASLRSQADSLLLNVLPVSVADRLKRGESVADVYDQASILFADMVNFTPFSGRLSLPDLVKILGDVFCEFDELAAAHGLERIKTMGDGYLVASGVPAPRADHAEILVDLALDMRSYFKRQTFAGQQLNVRLGVNSGPVVAAVIGQQRFSYDVWGDTVNVASRMQSQGRAGVVQITPATYRLVRHKFLCEAGGSIDVKGKGTMDVWHVLGPR